MEEKKGKKLLKLLNKWGVSPEEAQAFLDDYDNTPDEEEEVLEETPTEVEDTEPVVEEEPSTEAPSEEVPTEVAEEEPVVEDEEVGEVAEEPTADLPTEPEMPVEEPQVGEPVVEEQPNMEVEAMQARLDELQTAYDGLVAKVEAMQENLAKSGLVDYAEEQPIGVDENTAPATGVESHVSNIVDRLNRGRTY